MKRISRDSMAKRLHYVKRRLRKRAGRNLFPQDSEQQLLRRQEQAHYTLIIYFGTYLITIGSDKLFGIFEKLDFGFYTSICVLIYLFYLCYSLFKLRWALEAFEQFGPQRISDLEKNISETNDANQPIH